LRLPGAPLQGSLATRISFLTTVAVVEVCVVVLVDEGLVVDDATPLVLVRVGPARAELPPAANHVTNTVAIPTAKRPPI
jgi:hypothetical protein